MDELTKDAEIMIKNKWLNLIHDSSYSLTYGNGWKAGLVEALKDEELLRAQGYMQAPQWMETSMELPRDYGPLWFYTRGKLIRGNYHEHTKEFVGQMGTEYAESEVTHWMPFFQPKPPKTEV